MPLNNILLVGLGRQTRDEIIPALSRLGKVIKVVGGADINKIQRQKFGKILTDVQTGPDYKKMLTSLSQKPDFVVMALPHNLYLDAVRFFCEWHIPIVKEKPLCSNISEALEVQSMAEEKRVPIFTIEKRKFYPAYMDAATFLQKISPIYQYSATHYVTGGNLHYGWKSKKKTAGGGVLINLGYHLFGVLLDYFGQVDQVKMYTANLGRETKHQEVEDAASLLIRHKNGVFGTFHMNCYSPVKRESIEIHGSRGSIYLEKNSLKVIDYNQNILFEKQYHFDGVDAVEACIKSYLKMDFVTIDRNLRKQVSLMKLITELYNDY